MVFLSCDKFRSYYPYILTVVLLCMILKTQHVPCDDGWPVLLVHEVRVLLYYLAHVILCLWGSCHVLHCALSGWVMMKTCYRSIWDNIGRWMEYPWDVACGVVGVILMIGAAVGTVFQFQYAPVSIQGNCTYKEVVDIVNTSLLAIKVFTTVVFVLYQSLLLGGSFIASTACQGAIDDTTIPQFNRELHLLGHTNVILLIDQLVLYFTRGASWSLVLLVAHYFTVLVVTYMVHFRLKKTICAPTDDNGFEEQKQHWLKPLQASLLSFFDSIVSLLPDQYMWCHLALHCLLAVVVRYIYVLDVLVIFLNLSISYASLVLAHDVWRAFVSQLVVGCSTGLKYLMEIIFSADLMCNSLELLLNGARNRLGFVRNCSNVIACIYGLLSFGNVVYLFFAISACNGEDSVLCWISSALVLSTNAMVVVREVHLVLLREEVNADVSPNKSDTRVSFVKLTYWYHVALSLTMFLWVYKCPVSLWTMWLSILLPCQLLLPGILLFSPTTPRETPLAIPVQPEQD